MRKARYVYDEYLGLSGFCSMRSSAESVRHPVLCMLIFSASGIASFDWKMGAEQAFAYIDCETMGQWKDGENHAGIGRGVATAVRREYFIFRYDEIYLEIDDWLGPMLKILSKEHHIYLGFLALD